MVQVRTPQMQGSEYEAHHWLQSRICAKNALALTHSILEFIIPRFNGRILVLAIYYREQQ